MSVISIKSFLVKNCNTEIINKKIKTLYRDIRISIRLLKTILRYRWGDHYFTTQLIKTDLEIKSELYKTDAYTEGAAFTAKRAQVLLKYLNEYIECDQFFDEESCKEKRRKFFNIYSRNYEKFWD